MGRIARKYLDASFFHVIVQGINKEYIFKTERYIKRYMEFVYREIDRFNLRIIAFCIMNNHAHFLINIENIEELSKYMQKLNSSYARYYNYMEGRVGYVFRDRYKSEPINNRRYLIQCVKYIHENPVKAKMVKNAYDYKYSSYNIYRDLVKNNKGSDIFLTEELYYICNDNVCSNMSFIDIDINFEENINNYISNFILKEGIKVFEIFENSDILKELIKYLKKSCKVKYVDIMRYFSITKGTMERLKS